MAVFTSGFRVGKADARVSRATATAEWCSGLEAGQIFIHNALDNAYTVASPHTRIILYPVFNGAA